MQNKKTQALPLRYASCPLGSYNRAYLASLRFAQIQLICWTSDTLDTLGEIYMKTR